MVVVPEPPFQLALGQALAYLDLVQEITRHTPAGPVDGAVAHPGERGSGPGA